MSIKLHYESLGEGGTIMILHGLFGSSRNWQGIARQLSKNYNLLMPDLRNHGKSPHADEMSYEHMADDLMRLLEPLDVERLSLIGHSMGGKVAMIFALKYPELVDKLIVMDIAPVAYLRGFRDIIEAMLKLPLSNIETRNQANQKLEKDISDAGVRTFLLQNLTRDGDSYKWRINLHAIKNNLTLIGGFPELQNTLPYRGKTLFMGGANSDYIQHEHHEDIRTLFPNARIDTIANAGHWLHADQPQLVIEGINQFLDNPSLS